VAVESVRSGRAVIDAAVVAVLAGWAVIGPLSDDDGFAAMIARNSRIAGYQGNYYRWWNASETPFALAQHVLAPLTEISLSPLWLRLPSTVLAIATWFTLSRGVLGAALPNLASAPKIRVLAAMCFLACWLPYNLGVRPEAYVAFGVTAVLALLWRGRSVLAVGAAALVAGVTATASPAAVLLAAPLLVFVARIGRLIRADAAGRGSQVARAAALTCLAASVLVVVFADQSGYAVAQATRWHAEFGPSLPWSAENLRYTYLLAGDQDGSATKRIPVLLTLALLVPTALLLARRSTPGTGRDAAGPGAARLTAVTALGLLSLWLTPSKWTHYFGALAGVFAAFLVVAIVLMARSVGRVTDATSGGGDPPNVDPVPARIGLIGTGVVALGAGLAFSGPNAWWQPVIYNVPWAHGPIRPAGIPLDSPLLWAGGLAAAYLVGRAWRGRGTARVLLVAGPSVVASATATASVLLLVGSFVAAPLRQPAGSLAISNLHRLVGTPTCGLGDDVHIFPDVANSVMVPSEPEFGTKPGTEPGSTSGWADSGWATGFDFGSGYDPSAPPPDPPGTGASAQLWGSRRGDALGTGKLTTPWFALPIVRPGQEVAVSVAGRTDRGNSLSLEFGRATAGGGPVIPLGQRVPPDPLADGTGAPGQDGPDAEFGGFDQSGDPASFRLWRAIGVPAAEVPPGADRVRLNATDASSDPSGWLSVTGPRLRHEVELRQYLRQHGPTLVAWPIAFLFPCAANVVGVRDGLAQAPVTVLEAPGQYAGLSSVSSDSTAGGDFAALRLVGRLGQVTNRLVGGHGADWGDVLLTNYPAARDAYRATVRWARVSGLRGFPEWISGAR
jgi:arabinosyltransferase C